MNHQLDHLRVIPFAAQDAEVDRLAGPDQPRGEAIGVGRLVIVHASDAITDLQPGSDGRSVLDHGDHRANLIPHADRLGPWGGKSTSCSEPSTRRSPIRMVLSG